MPGAGQYAMGLEPMTSSVYRRGGGRRATVGAVAVAVISRTRLPSPPGFPLASSQQPE